MRSFALLYVALNACTTSMLPDAAPPPGPTARDLAGEWCTDYAMVMGCYSLYAMDADHTYGTVIEGSGWDFEAGVWSIQGRLLWIEFADAYSTIYEIETRTPNALVLRDLEYGERLNLLRPAPRRAW